MKKLILLFLSVSLSGSLASGQVKIRLFASKTPLSAVFSVTRGRYDINFPDGETITLTEGEPVIVVKTGSKLAVKARAGRGWLCDSVIFADRNGDGRFSLKINDRSAARQYYSGDLHCLNDLGTILFINDCDVENYVAGVVMAEGGSGRNLEYFKTQAIIARTYMYKSFGKHLTDKYNVCDNTHCQAFNGLSTDSMLSLSASETKGLVILDKDSVLINSTFHSNCGGETASSEDVWLTDQSYLKSVTDPYCSGSRNSTWRKSYSVNEWMSYLRSSGYKGSKADSSAIDFYQVNRAVNYKTAALSIPLLKIRNDLNLRSTFFSVTLAGDSVILTGRGYGHGVGLCQEGAMNMASKGFKYSDIIRFYYSGVIISDIKNAVNLPEGRVVKTYLYTPGK